MRAILRLSIYGAFGVAPCSSSRRTHRPRTYNRFNWKPAVILYPKAAAEVAAAVKCGATHGVKVNARSGGHSCQSFLPSDVLS